MQTKRNLNSTDTFARNLPLSKWQHRLTFAELSATVITTYQSDSEEKKETKIFSPCTSVWLVKLVKEKSPGQTPPRCVPKTERECVQFLSSWTLAPVRIAMEGDMLAIYNFNENEMPDVSIAVVVYQRTAPSSLLLLFGHTTEAHQSIDRLRRFRPSCVEESRSERNPYPYAVPCRRHTKDWFQANAMVELLSLHPHALEAVWTRALLCLLAVPLLPPVCCYKMFWTIILSPSPPPPLTVSYPV